MDNTDLEKPRVSAKPAAALFVAVSVAALLLLVIGACAASPDASMRMWVILQGGKVIALVLIAAAAIGLVFYVLRPAEPKQLEQKYVSNALW